jgi:hypothetical protein
MRTLPTIDDEASPLRPLARMLEELDELQLDAWQRITGYHPDEGDLIEIRLPQRFAGLGFLACRAHADAAFIAASVHAGTLTARILGLQQWQDPHLPMVLERFNAQLKEDDRLEMGHLSPATLKQHELVDKVARLQYDRLLELRPDPRDRARLLSLRQPNSVLTALNAPPNPRRELHLSNARFPLAIRFILGKLPQEGEKCSLCGL